MDIEHAPPILVIQLKRFRLVLEAEKNDSFVAFPLDFFNPYGDTHQDAARLYECYAVINHHGSLNGGHYTAYAREKDKWFLFDDTFVSPVPDVGDVVNPAAYLLFYRRKDLSLQRKAGAAMEGILDSVAQTLDKFKDYVPLAQEMLIGEE